MQQIRGIYHVWPAHAMFDHSRQQVTPMGAPARGVNRVRPSVQGRLGTKLNTPVHHACICTRDPYLFFPHT